MKKADILRQLHALDAKLDRALERVYAELAEIKAEVLRCREDVAGAGLASKHTRPISRKKVKELTSLSLAQIDRLEKAGKGTPICQTTRPRLSDHPSTHTAGRPIPARAFPPIPVARDCPTGS